MCRCKDTIKRAANRKPQAADCFTRHGEACTHSKCRYHTHLRNCGGAYVKVKEPEPKKKAPKASKSRQKAAASADKPPKGQGTLSAVFARGSGGTQQGGGINGSGGREHDQEAPRVFDLLDDAIDQASPWLAGTSHTNAKGTSLGGSAPGADSRALETDVVNLLNLLVPCAGVMVTARGGGVSTGGPTPTDSADAGPGTGATAQVSGQHQRGGDAGGFVDLTNDVDEKSSISQKPRMAVKRKAVAAVAAAGSKSDQISLLSESDDDAEQRGGAAGTSHGAKRRRSRPSAGVSARLAVCGDDSKPPQRQKDLDAMVEHETGDAIDLDDSEPDASDIPACEGTELSKENRERARRRALCAAAAAARVARNKADPPDQNLDGQESE